MKIGLFSFSEEVNTYSKTCNKPHESGVIQNAMSRSYSIIAGLCLALAGSLQAEEAPNFRLTDQLGRSFELHRQKHAPVLALAFVDTSAAEVVASLKQLSTLKTSAGTNAIFMAVDLHPTTPRDRLRDIAFWQGVTFPVLQDPVRLVADTFGRPKSGELFVFRTADWKIVAREKSSALQAASFPDQCLAWAKKDKDFIKLPAPTVSAQAISYSKQIAPLLQAHCASCHSEGNIGPFAFSSYEKVRGWASTIREVLLTQRMPPWHADPHFGKFDNALKLPEKDARLIVDWIDAGAKKDGTEDPLQKTQVTAIDWPLGKPDAIVKMPRAQSIAATGVFGYRYFTMPSPFPSNAWLRAAVVRPTNRKVLHHVLVFVKNPGERRSAVLDSSRRGYIAVYAPGLEQGEFPEGTAKKLPGQSEIIFQMHYTATGKPETDDTELGLYLAKEEPKAELQTKAAAQTLLLIPPHMPDAPMQADFRFAKDSILYELFPHMHLRGKRFQYEAFYPNGKKEVLLSVPHYDFNWQRQYRLEKPLQIPAGTILRATGAFDNSSGNPFNPDPKIWVGFGEQTFNEMFIGYFNYAETPSPGQRSSR